MATYNYKLIDGEYQEITDEYIDDIQSQQNTPKMSTQEFKSWVLPSNEQYKYVSNGSSYDVTNIIKSEFEKETQSLNDKYGSDLSTINTSFDNSKKELDTAREKELQNEYVKKEKEIDILPSYLAQAGLSGGANQTENMRIETDYEGARSDVESFFLNELNKLIKERDEQLRKEQEEYNKAMESAAKSYQSDLNSASSKAPAGSYVYSPSFSTNLKAPNKDDNTSTLDSIVNELYTLYKGR